MPNSYFVPAGTNIILYSEYTLSAKNSMKMISTKDCLYEDNDIARAGGMRFVFILPSEVQPWTFVAVDTRDIQVI